MTDFKQFRQKSNGAIVWYPEHYIDHPVFGDDLEPFYGDEDEYEVDKVVVAGHEVPVDQRGISYAIAYEDMTVEELRDTLRGRDLAVSGNKEELIARLTADNSDKNED